MYKIVVMLAVLAGVFLVVVAWQAMQPAWYLSATNGEEGVLIEVHRGEDEQPTYSTILEDHHLPRNIHRTTVADFPKDIGTTGFADETIRPGRWIVHIDGVKLDIMESGLIIDDKTTIKPSE